MKLFWFSALYISIFLVGLDESRGRLWSAEPEISSVDKLKLPATAIDSEDDPRTDQVIGVINRFFEGLKIKNQASKKYRQHITDDFFIFEMGKKYSMKELVELFQKDDRQWVSTDWKLSEFRVSLDENSAHVSYVNTGVFYFNQDGKKFRSDLKWLESVYLVKRGDQWKMKFLQSDDVSRKTEEVKTE